MTRICSFTQEEADRVLEARNQSTLGGRLRAWGRLLSPFDEADAAESSAIQNILAEAQRDHKSLSSLWESFLLKEVEVAEAKQAELDSRQQLLSGAVPPRCGLLLFWRSAAFQLPVQSSRGCGECVKRVVCFEVECFVVFSFFLCFFRLSRFSNCAVRGVCWVD